jgi:energy-coupling factor transporter ATP-binding protein EcfA2
MDPQPSLVADTPTTDDKFGGHSSVAQAVVDLIANSEESFTIAIDGRWGSGKSTVVELINELGDEAQKVFTFDSWSHQGDDLKFGFLQEFCAWAVANFDAIEDELALLDSRISEDQRKQSEQILTEPTTPIGTAGVVLALAVLVGLPLGLTLFELATLFDGYAKSAFALAIMSAVSLVAPLIVALWLGVRRGSGGLALELSRALTGATGKTKTIVHRTLPPATASEFSSKLQTALKHVFAAYENSRLLIVFDNLDRIAPENSARVWSLLSSIGDALKAFRGTSTHKQTFLLVPIDTTTLPDPTPRGVAADESRFGDSQDYIQKVFQVVVHVPPPLESSQDRFFEKTFSQAFGKTALAGRHHLVYQIYLKHLDHPVSTPRSIKRFVNDLAAAYLVRHNLEPATTPSIELVAYYVTQAGKPEFVKTLGPKTAVPTGMAHVIRDDDPLRDIASLVFGCSSKDALVILVANRVGAALTEYDPSSIEELRDHSGFAEAFRRFGIERLDGWERAEPGMAARWLSTASELGILENVAVRAAAEPIAQSLLSAELEWAISNPAEARGLAIAYRVQLSPIEAWSGQLGAQLTSINSENEMEPELAKQLWEESVCEAVPELVVGYSESDPDVRLLTDRVPLPDSDDLAIAAITSDALSDVAGYKLDVFAETEQIHRVCLRLSDVIQSESLSPNLPSAAGWLASRAEDDGRNALYDGLFSRLQKPEDEKDQCRVVLEILGRLTSYSEEYKHTEYLQSVVRPGYVSNKSRVLDQREAPLLALMSHIYSRSDVPRGEIASHHDSAAALADFESAVREATLDETALRSFVAELVNRRVLMGTIATLQDYGLPRERVAVVREAVRQGAGLIDAGWVVKKLFNWWDHEDESAKLEVVRELNEKKEFDKKLRADPALIEIVRLEDIGVVVKSVDHSASKRVLCREFARSFESKDEEWWRAVIEGSHPERLEVLELIAAHSDLPPAGSSARIVVGRLLIDEGGLGTPVFVSNAMKVVSLMGSEEKEQIATRLSAHIVSLGAGGWGVLRDMADVVLSSYRGKDELDPLITNVLAPTIELGGPDAEAASVLASDLRLSKRLGSKAKAALASAVKAGTSG